MQSTVGIIFHLLSGPLLWALHFTMIYGAQSLLCARGMSGPVATIVLGATLIALVPLIAIAAWPARRRADANEGGDRRARVHIARLLAALSAIGVLWACVTAISLPACASLR